MGQGWKLCCCQISVTLLWEQQGWALCLTDRLRHKENIYPPTGISSFIFWTYYLIVKRNYLKESTNTQDQQIIPPCFWVCFPLYSAANTWCDSGFAMLLTLLPVHVMLWCPGALIRWTNVGTNWDTSSRLALHCQWAETREDPPFLSLTLILQALSHGLPLRAADRVSWGMGQISKKSVFLCHDLDGNLWWVKASPWHPPHTMSFNTVAQA